MTFGVSREPVVLDASAAVEMVLGASIESRVVSAWITAGRMILVPDHFWPEVANALLVRRRLPVDAVRLRLAGLREIGLESAAAIPRRLDEALSIADRNRLSVYDALYVQIALETDAGVATHDRAMRQAAEAEGVEIEALD